MITQEKLALLDSFEAAFNQVTDQLTGLPAEALAFVPAIPGAWSINDHLVHLLDAEAAVYFRLRLAQAEPGSRIQPWEEEAWQARLGYQALDGRACLALAQGLRSVAARGLRAKVDEDWSAFVLDHPTRGKMDLVSILELYRDHLSFHAPFVKRNLEAWRAKG